MPWVRVIQVIQFNAELFAVFNQLLHLDTRHFAGRINVFSLRRYVVIHRGEGFTRLAYRTFMGAQAVKRLRRGHLVNQMTVNVQQWGFVWCLVDNVRIKQFFV